MLCILLGAYHSVLLCRFLSVFWGERVIMNVTYTGSRRADGSCCAESDPDVVGEFATTDEMIEHANSSACNRARMNHRALVARLKTHPWDRGVESVSCWVMVTCTHTYHEVIRFYMDMEEYTTHFHHVTNDLWVNGYTMLIQPMAE